MSNTVIFSPILRRLRLCRSLSLSCGMIRPPSLHASSQGLILRHAQISDEMWPASTMRHFAIWPTCRLSWVFMVTHDSSLTAGLITLLQALWVSCMMLMFQVATTAYEASYIERHATGCCEGMGSYWLLEKTPKVVAKCGVTIRVLIFEDWV